MTSADAVHAMLLGFAGRIPDRYLTDLRYSLSLGDQREVAYAVEAIARRRKIPLRPAELTALAEILGTRFTRWGMRDVVAPAPGDRVPFEFTPLLPESVALTVAPMPRALDLTGVLGSAGHAPDDLDVAAVEAAREHSAVIGVWRSWRTPARPEQDGWPQTPRRVYLVEVGSAGLPWIVAADVASALHTSGEADGQVEVYTTGNDLPRYQLSARARSCLLWAANDTAPRIPAPFTEHPVRFAANHPRLTDSRAAVRYLRTAPVVCRASGLTDTVEPESAVPVPMTIRTDGRWVWPEAVAHYLDEYGLAPDPALTEHLRTAGPPPLFVDGVALFRAGIVGREVPGPRSIVSAEPTAPQRHRCAPVPAAVLRVAWSRLPDRLDLTDLSGLDDLVDLLIDRGDQAVIGAVRGLGPAVGLWRAWRFPAHEPPRRGHRHYLVEVSSMNAFHRAAGPHWIERISRAAGRSDGQPATIEVLATGAPRTTGQTGVLDKSALLWARTRPESRTITRVRAFVTPTDLQDGVLRCRAEIAAQERRAPVAAYWAELRRNRMAIGAIPPEPEPADVHPPRKSARRAPGDIARTVGRFVLRTLFALPLAILGWVLLADNPSVARWYLYGVCGWFVATLILGLLLLELGSHLHRRPHEAAARLRSRAAAERTQRLEKWQRAATGSMIELPGSLADVYTELRRAERALGSHRSTRSAGEGESAAAGTYAGAGARHSDGLGKPFDRPTEGAASRTARGSSPLPGSTRTVGGGGWRRGTDARGSSTPSGTDRSAARTSHDSGEPHGGGTRLTGRRGSRDGGETSRRSGTSRGSGVHGIGSGDDPFGKNARRGGSRTIDAVRGRSRWGAAGQSVSRTGRSREGGSSGGSGSSSSVGTVDWSIGSGGDSWGGGSSGGGWSGGDSGGGGGGGGCGGGSG
ncbi:hypothetical protein IU438_02990 [Nocardia cyriacigeorgica]|uniref:hypothetical protein n=1 Tax=Nocardia cyriacigeorgica TaxID=135487 RepID=UPI00189322A9|nr:hypothetical protein [Nocardia cyriacigeorgica]MBF6091611.1 hypothetical protein [Nocardia cyriacigeorgica]MBF6394753.1 hypothetical protein [Nocardia cyriacigeorgica]MBF6400387.1 hypothetical protein [Nocardia cyriacigeorgica]